MPKRVLPRIVAVTLGEAPLTLHVRWGRGGENSVDVSDMVASFRVYAPLRSSPELFRQVQVGEYGTDIVWPGDIDMSADTLWRLAQEQSGATMTPDEFRQWRERKAYTLDEAARALGLSRRMVAYYEKGNRPIPRVVALATRGLAHDDEVDACSGALEMLNPPMSSWAAYEIMRQDAEAIRAKLHAKPQGAPPDPARGSMEWLALQEKQKNSS